MSTFNAVDPKITPAEAKAALDLVQVGVIGLYTFINYAKHLTQPALDFPSVDEFKPEIVT